MNQVKNLIECKRRNENNGSKNAITAAVYTVVMVIGILACCICDMAVSGTLTWSLIVLGSVLAAWLASFPVILFGKKGILASMTAISILMIPFIYLLSVLTKINEIFSIGAIISIIALAFLWIIYILYYRFKKRKLLATGIIFLFAVPFTFLINTALSKMTGEPVVDAWDILATLILLIIAVVFIIGDRVRKKVM